MYESLVSRFCSRDPIGYEGSEWSLCEAFQSNPTNNVDPEGEDIIRIGDTNPNVTPENIRKCRAHCRATGKKYVQTIKQMTYCQPIIDVYTLYWVLCVCEDRPDNNNRCTFEYMWCVWGVNRAKDPDEKDKPWPKTMRECVECLRECRKSWTQSWGCRRPRRDKAPDFDEPTWPEPLPRVPF
jgi:hypothetical protein